jgi:hypothetical protein
MGTKWVIPLNDFGFPYSLIEKSLIYKAIIDTETSFSAVPPKIMANIQEKLKA